MKKETDQAGFKGTQTGPLVVIFAVVRIITQAAVVRIITVQSGRCSLGCSGNVSFAQTSRIVMMFVSEVYIVSVWPLFV